MRVLLSLVSATQPFSFTLGKDGRESAGFAEFLVQSEFPKLALL
jgi:hypothetical protein